MTVLLLTCALLAAVAWLIGRAVLQSRLFVRLDPHAPACDEVNLPAIAVIVPVRDEAANIGACLEALLAQEYPPARLSIIVVDDHSADATAALAASFKTRDARVRLLRAPPLAAGWTGKCSACWTGACAADAGAEWLCFIDADVRAQPSTLTAAWRAAAAEGIDLLSLTPRQELVGFAERLIMPCGFYMLAFRQNLARLQSPGCAEATATGQFMLVRREAYLAAGGHAGVCGAICEDTALARALKRCGAKVLLRGGEGLLSTRMYSGWSTLWPGVTKNLCEMLGGSRATMVTTAAAVVLAWASVLIPLAAVLGCLHRSWAACAALVPALAASAAAFGFHIAGAVYFGVPFWYGFLFPLGYGIGACMALDSVRRRLTGRVTWKGRTYS